MIRTVLSLLLAASCTLAGADRIMPVAANGTDVLAQLNKRTALLQQFSSLRDKGNCSTRSGTISISLKYGREGNLWMQYLNLIWFAKYLNRTPVIPRSDKIFKDFDLKYLYSAFCLTDRAMSGVHGKPSHLGIKANEIHGPFHLYKKYARQLPPQKSAEALETAADDMLFFFSAIYAGVKTHMVNMLASYINDHLRASFNYVVIQKRNYEGSCFHILYRYSEYSDYSSDQFDKTTDEWKQYCKIDKSMEVFRRNISHWGLAGDPPVPTYHPLCNMTLGLIQGAVRTQLHRLHQPPQNLTVNDPSSSSSSSSPQLQYFFMSDKQVPITPDVTAALNPLLYSGPEASLMDRLIATHSLLFIRNSASSFSLSSDVLRRVLSLPLSGLADNSPADYFFSNWISYQNVTTMLHRRKEEFTALLLRAENKMNHNTT